jgi:hypothetical protein
LYEWKGLKKLYAHIIRQIENGLADWPKDFGEVETPFIVFPITSSTNML